MLNFIKILILLFSLLLIAAPMMNTKRRLKKFAPINALKYEKPNNKKNVFFIILSVLGLIVFVLCVNLIYGLTETVYAIPYVGSLFEGVVDKVGVSTEFVVFVVFAIIVNVIVLYLYIILKSFLKKAIIDPLYSSELEKSIEEPKKQAESVEDKKEEEKEENKDEENNKLRKEEDTKDSKLPKFIHAYKEKKKVKEEQKETEEVKTINSNFLSRIFFSGPDYIYAKGWVVRAESILQCFITIVKLLYLLTFAILLTIVLFPVSDGIYNFLLNIIHIDAWYIYPYISLIILQEICNTLHTGINEDEVVKQEKSKAEEDEIKSHIKIRALQSELKRRFDKEHVLRYYPSKRQKKNIDYKITNKEFASALEFIKNQMQANNVESGSKYLESLDAMYNENNVYFNASFYSEFGEYLISYTYTRLLSGSRMIFVISDATKKDFVKKYILKRLTKMTGCTEKRSWRVYTSDERLDQADILIATPDDFKDDNIVEHYPDFFDEVCNAVFIDADRIVSIESYLCQIMALRLQHATRDRIKFIFLSKDLIRGFAVACLPKFFCLDKVLSFSSASDNENVDFTLWNKESLNNRIYERDGQKVTSLEAIIADLAYSYGIDGVRVVSKEPFDASEMKMLQEHNVEINRFYKDVPRVNYMVYTDESCNLSAAIYACTRFRGKEGSVVHIISKPYLLRDYFASKAMKENYIKRASFIQPRATAHAENEKIGLLKIFCHATTANGIRVKDFLTQMKDLLLISKVRNEIPLCEFCADQEKFGNIENLTLKNAAAFLIAGLCDDHATPIKESMGQKAKDFYLIVDHAHQDIYSLNREKYITFKKVKEVFEKLLANNEMVELRLNDKTIGHLDTFSSRLSSEYIVGQTLVYNNTEYEIEQFSNDNKIIFLRRENVTFKNCSDTFFLRRYLMKGVEKITQDGVLFNSTAILEEIRVSLLSASFEGETYGFYNLMSNNQSLDFVHGVEGNPHLEQELVEKSKRIIDDGRILRVKLKSKIECTDGMRMLLSTVFNEFIKTIFPNVYRCIAVCPILEKPLDFTENKEAITQDERIATLYPYLKTPSDEFVEKDNHNIQLLIINDCKEDVGVFEWLYDKLASNMYEFLVNVYSYLNWVNLRKDLHHFIYFGDDKFASCYDIDGCCKLFEGFNLILSDDGKKDYETAGQDNDDEEKLRCSFCHRLMESGRYMSYDEDKYICADCMDVVEDYDTLTEVYDEVLSYLRNMYPDVQFGYLGLRFFDNEKEDRKELNEWFFKLDPDKRIVAVQDLPYVNMKVALLCAIISMWQIDNNLVTQYSDAQLSYEEMELLKHLEKDDMVLWISENLSEERKDDVDSIVEYIKYFEDEQKQSEDTEDKPQKEKSRKAIKVTSFSFMIAKGNELNSEDILDDSVEFEEEDYSDTLYDHYKAPRFWKRYIKGETVDDGKEDVVFDDLSGELDNEEVDDLDAETVDENVEDESIPENSSLKIYYMTMENAPMSGNDDVDDTDDLFDDTDDEDFSGDDSELDETDNNESVDDIDDLDSLTDEEIKDDEEVEDDKVGDEGDDGLSDKENDTDKVESKKKKKKDKKEKKVKEKKIKEKKPKEKKVKKGAKTEGWKIVPFEDDEEKNPKIKFYNTIIRNAYDFKEEPISRSDIPNDQEMINIFCSAIDDYPELFWVNKSRFKYNDKEFFIVYRCKKPDGSFDKKQINRKLKELRSGAKFFLKGISKRTDPYKAFLTIYKRLILTVDYDGKGLDKGIDNDFSQDDRLRSLHSAIVRHKTVCAGYAAALQYLLQSIGITCGYVVSESCGSSAHAFNIVKIGKCCYYVDATWGDSSNTKSGDENNDIILYHYCCVPYEEFITTTQGQEKLHTPKDIGFAFKKDLHANAHEYYRYHKAFLTRYNEDDIVRIIVNLAKNYNPKEDGRFYISFRCASVSLAKKVSSLMLSTETYSRIIGKAKFILRKDKKAVQLLDKKVLYSIDNGTSVVNIILEKDKRKK